MDVNGHQSLEFATVHFGLQVRETSVDQFSQHLGKFLVGEPHYRFIPIPGHFQQGVLEIHRPHELNTQQGHLCA